MLEIIRFLLLLQQIGKEARLPEGGKGEGAEQSPQGAEDDVAY